VAKNNVYWVNGLICNKRTKKPLSIRDISKVTKASNRDFGETFKAGWIFKDSEGYKIKL
jgi:hypothetical protein